MQTKPLRNIAGALQGAVRQKNIPGLDALRASAIVLVMLFHFGQPVGPAIGVIVFFVLSGFLITGILLKEISKSGTLSIKTFYIRRAYRIFPAFYVCWFLTMGLSLWTHRHVTWANAVQTFFYLADYGRAFLPLQEQQYHYLMGISWSLAVEEQFYLLWPLLLLKICKLKNPLRCIRWIIVGLWVWRAILVVVFHVSWDYAYNAFDTRADALMIGCWLAFAISQMAVIKPVLWWLSNKWFVLAPLLCLGAINFLDTHGRIGPSLQVIAFTADPILIAVLLMQLIYWGSVGWKFLEKSAIKFIARISYSLYLYHELVHKLLPEHLNGIHHGRTAIILAVILLVSIASYYGIERPFILMRDRGRRKSVLIDDGIDVGMASVRSVDEMQRLDGPNARLIGKPGGLRELTTPALVLDLDVFEQNVRAYQQQINLHGLRARPHSKSHKCAEIARRQIAAGAVGVCTASLHEAEAMVGQGIDNILVTSPVVGAGKLDRLMQLLERGALVAVVVDDQEYAASMASAAHRSGHVLDVLIDVDLGMGRTGISNIESALQLVNVVCDADGLSYRGIQAYSGRVQHIQEFAERDYAYTGQLRFLSALIAALDKRGLKPATVSGGGTGTLALDCREGLLTEHQAGSYIFMDVEYGAVTLRANDADPAFATSLFLHSTVISKNVPGQVTIDAGLKSFATDGPLPLVSAGAPAGTTYTFFGDEHGCLTFPTSTDSLPLGSIVACVTPHCDPTINLHDYLHVVQQGTVVDIWQIVGRGVL